MLIFSSIFQGVNKHNGETVAVKTFNQLSHMRPQEVQMREFEVGQALESVIIWVQLAQIWNNQNQNLLSDKQKNTQKVLKSYKIWREKKTQKEIKKCITIDKKDFFFSVT